MISESKLHSLIESLAPSWINFIQKLVKIPSYTGDEYKAQDLVYRTMKDIGIFHKNIYYNDKDKKYPERNYEDRPNVIGLIKGNNDLNFILNAHIDTAHVENELSWKFHPFSGEICDGKLYGRGALDDKAGVAMMLMIAQAFKESGSKLPFNVYIESVIEDEDTGNGSKACLESGIYADAGIIIDGTWPFHIIDAHLGQLWIDFDIQGQQVASCSYMRGVNPIYIACNLLNKLSSLVNNENMALRRWHNIENPYFITPGIFVSGCYPGAVPEKCNLVCQVGFPPPENVESICKKIEYWIKEQIQEEDNIQYKIKYLSTDPFENRNNRLVRILNNNIKRLRPGEMEPINVAVMGHCDLRYFRNRNGKLSEACLYGPGGGGNPHVKDEYYLVDHFISVAQNIISTMLNWHKEKTI